MRKVSFFDKKIHGRWLNIILSISTIGGFTLAFFPEIPLRFRIIAAIACLLIIGGSYAFTLRKARAVKSRAFKINGSEIIVCEGDIFNCDGLSIIAVNEFFDTQVDEKIISSETLHGQYIQRFWQCKTDALDHALEADKRISKNIIEYDVSRPSGGKTSRYKLGTCFQSGNFVLTAMTKFDNNNAPHITVAEYFSFLCTMWDEISILCQGKDVFTPVLGGGVTIFDGSNALSLEERINLMLLSFKYHASSWRQCSKAHILIHKEEINSLDMYHLGEQVL